MALFFLLTRTPHIDEVVLVRHTDIPQLGRRLQLTGLYFEVIDAWPEACW